MLKRIIFAITFLIILTFSYLTVSLLPAGSIYKWTDEKGNIHYSDTYVPRKHDKNIKKFSRPSKDKKSSSRTTIGNKTLPTWKTDLDEICDKSEIAKELTDYEIDRIIKNANTLKTVIEMESMYSSLKYSALKTLRLCKEILISEKKIRNISKDITEDIKAIERQSK